MKQIDADKLVVETTQYINDLIAKHGSLMRVPVFSDVLDYAAKHDVKRRYFIGFGCVVPTFNSVYFKLMAAHKAHVLESNPMKDMVTYSPLKVARKVEGE